MFKVDKEKCIGCGLCVKDCFVSDIKLKDGKAEIRNVTCIKCGHCVAICPKDAVSTDEYNMNEVKEYDEKSFHLDSENLLNFIKFRRTVRHFKNKDVENEKLLKIIEAGRFTQTASNAQNVSYVVVKNQIDELRTLTLESLKDLGEVILQTSTTPPLYKRYAKRWISMYNENISNPEGKDDLFFKAPAVILVISEHPVNAALASKNMELMTVALGLGTLFSGFLVRAAQDNSKIKDFLGLKENQQVVTCMVIGYPDVKYFRTVPRKDAEILWK